MKQYLISMYQPEGPIPPPEVLEPVMRELGVQQQELEAEGRWVFGNGLHEPSTATVIRAQESGDVVMTDGPYVEGKEYLGGFSIIKAPDLDTALAYGRRQAEITGLPIEVRPFQGDADD